MESGLHIFDGECFYAVRVERSAFYRDSGYTNEIGNVFGKRNTVTRGQDYIGDAALVGNKEHGAAGGHAEFCAEGVVVSVGVVSEKAIGIREFAVESNGFTTHRLAGEKVQVPIAGHFFCFEQIRDEPPELSVGHAVQAVVVSELESGQYQNCEKAECCDQEYFSWTCSLQCC